MSAHATLTPGLYATLQEYRAFQRTHGRPPTLSEVAEALRVTPQAISLRCKDLERLGYLRKAERTEKPRGLYGLTRKRGP